MDAGQAPRPQFGVLFFHFVFKVTAVIYFWLANYMSKDLVRNFVILMVLVAADFWVVKNVTGRLLVGLRWWNDESDQAGGTTWRFECLDQGQRQLNTMDVQCFWVGQIVACLLWTAAIIYEIISFQFIYLVIVFLSLTLSFSNLYGYYKCRSDARQKIQEMANSVFMGALKNQFWGSNRV